MAKAVLEKYNGYPAIMIDGQPYPPMMATIRTSRIDHLEMDADYFRHLGESGVRIFFLICDTEWLKPGAFALFRQEAETLLREVPDAYIIPRIGLHPSNEWIKEHPEELVRLSDGSSQPILLYTESYVSDLPAMYSLASSKWREAAGKALMDTYDRMEQLPYADRIIGFFLAAGNTSEWYYSGAEPRNGAVSDCSDAFRRSFGDFLKKKYGTEERLREAWNMPEASFADPYVPNFEERFYNKGIDAALNAPKHLYSTDPPPAPPKNTTNIGVFTDIDAHPAVFDYFRAWHLGTAESIVYFAKLIKARSAEKLVGAFYGSYGCTGYDYSSSAGGVLHILDSGAVDFLAAPGVYQNRQPGAFVGQREMVDSFRLRNRMYIIEEDTRTHAENSYYADLFELYSVEDTLNVMKRNFGRNLCEDIQAWWFDQHVGGGRYKFPEVYDLIAKQQKIARQAYERDRVKHNEIAFIYDEESIHAVSQQTTFEAVELFRDYELSLIGASVDQYYHNDMANPDMPSYKLYVFCNVYVLTEEEREAIRAKLKKDHAVALWLYAPGVIDPDGRPRFDAAHIEALTGIRVARLDDVLSPKFKINGTPHPLTDALDHGQIYGFNYRPMHNNLQPILFNKPTTLYPAFYSVDENAVNLAYFLQKHLPALTVKEVDGFTSVFCGARLLRADVVRAAAEFAGCHIFSHQDDVIYANRSYVTIHAASSGEKELSFPEECSPREVYEDRVYAERVRTLRFSMLKGETKTFELVK